MGSLPMSDSNMGISFVRVVVQSSSSGGGRSNWKIFSKLETLGSDQGQHLASRSVAWLVVDPEWPVLCPKMYLGRVLLTVDSPSFLQPAWDVDPTRSRSNALVS